MSNWIVELEPGVYLAPWSGDPGRTLEARNAQVFVSHPRARRAMLAAQKLRPFDSARVTLEKEPAPAGCYPEEWGPSTDRRLTCACGNEDPAHWHKTPNVGGELPATARANAE